MTEVIRLASSARVFDRQVGGNTRYVREIYSRLPRYGVEPSYLRIPSWLESRRTRSATYGIYESAFWPRAVTSGRFDALHYPADTGSVVPARIPTVGTIHGLATLHVDGVRSSSADALWRFRVRQLARVADRIITVSPSSAADIADFEPGISDRIVVIPHGIDHEIFTTQRSAAAATVRERYGLPDSFFLYAGNLDPRKNILQLARAANVVYQQTGVPLVISGAPAWDSGQIFTEVQSTTGVIYVGRTSDEDLVALMQNAVGFCFPSSYEGFGFPVLEAMACGCPVVCSKRGSLEFVAAGAAFLLDNIDRDSIAEGMLALLSDSALRASLVERGLARAREFDWSVSAQKHAGVFKELHQ